MWWWSQTANCTTTIIDKSMKYWYLNIDIEGSWPFPVNRNWSAARQEIQARHHRDPCCSRREQKQGFDFLACSWSGWAGSLNWVRVGAGPGVMLEGGSLGGLPTLLMVLFAGCMCSTLVLLLAPQQWQLCFWSFCTLLFIICANCMHLFFSPL